MKINLVTIHFPPEIGGGVHLGYELAKKLNSQGHWVHVITGFPHYNVKSVPEKYQKGNLMHESFDGLKVTRIRFPNFSRANKMAKGLQHISYGIWLAMLSLISIHDGIILTYSPPLPLPWLLCGVAKIRRLPIVVSIQDLFPLEAIELGMLTNRVLIKIFDMMEKQMNTNATRLTVHSPGNAKHVVSQGATPDKVDVVYNWVDTKRIKPEDRTNGFAQKNGLTKSFVVSYAGTMGWAQDMNTIVEAAELIRDHSDIVFLLVGDGVEKQKAIQKSREYGLTNIVWLPMQPWNVYPEILASSDVSMINLHPSLRTPVVPSKLISIMAAARPVIASVPTESDARTIINSAECGICVDAGDASGLAQGIIQLASDPDLCSKYGRQGRAYVEKNFTDDACTLVMESVLFKACQLEN